MTFFMSIRQLDQQQLSVSDSQFSGFATHALHKAWRYIGQKVIIAGMDTTMISISKGSPMRQ